MKITQTLFFVSMICCRCSCFIPSLHFKPNMIFKPYDNMTSSSNRKNFVVKTLGTVTGLSALAKATHAVNNEEDDEESDDTTKYPGEGFYIERENNNVYLYGDISVNSCIMLRKSLSEAAKLCKNLSLKYKIETVPINLYIQSNGGNLMTTLGVIDFIQNCDVPIHSHINGYAASSASIISVVCHKRYMSENSYALLHQLSASTSGKYNAMRQEITNMDSFMKTIKTVYLENTKIKEDEIDEILNKDLWWNAEKCLEMGVIDEIL